MMTQVYGENDFDNDTPLKKTIQLVYTKLPLNTGPEEPNPIVSALNNVLTFPLNEHVNNTNIFSNRNYNTVVPSQNPIHTEYKIDSIYYQ